MRGVLGCFLVGTTTVLAVTWGCSGDQNGANSSGDAGRTPDASRADVTADATETDAGNDGADDGDVASPPPGDGPIVCNAPGMPQGKQILASATATAIVQGVTSDGQVLYWDNATQHIGAVPVDGGTPVDVGPWDQAGGGWPVVYTSRDVALYWSGQSPPGEAGNQLWAWTRANGAIELAADTWIGPPANLGTCPFLSPGLGAGYATVDVSPDSAYVAYFDGAAVTDAGLVVGNVSVSGSDGSNPTVLVPGWIQGNCTPMIEFIGDYLVVSYAVDGLNGTIAAFGPAPNWQNVQTFTTTSSTCLFAGDTAATHLTYATSGGIYVQTLGATDPPTLIDPLGAGGLFTNDGSSLLYLRWDGSLWRSPVSSPAPVELAGGPFMNVLALSTDDAWIELTQNPPSANGNAENGIQLVSTAPGDGGNAVITLTDAGVAGNLMDAIPASGLAAPESSAGAFTADNSQAVFFEVPGVLRPGNLKHDGLPPSGVPATITQSFWGGYPTSGAKVVYADHGAKGQPSNGYWANGYADLESVDLSGTAPPTTLVRGADATFYLTADRSTLVYSWNYCSGIPGGIYTVPVP